MAPAETPDLTPESVNAALDEVRPYLIADGGNVEVASISDGIVYLRLQVCMLSSLLIVHTGCEGTPLPSKRFRGAMGLRISVLLGVKCSEFANGCDLIYQEAAAGCLA